MSLKQRLKKIIKLNLHRGTTFECPFCGFKSRDLEIVGHDLPILKEKHVIGGGRRAAGCYKCNSRDRERLLYAFLIEDLKIGASKNLKILHIAPEPKLSKILQSQNFKEYLCGDLFTEGYVYAENVQNMNVLNLPFQNDHFDYVICNHVLEHIEEDGKAMKEICRVLKIGGKAVLQVPISNNSAMTHEDFTIVDAKKRAALFGQFDHMRIYGQDYVQRLESNGFTVNKINISVKYKKFGLNPEEDLFFCEKPFH
ncbi:class I SAM-dependent methyltransferase [Chryseobacterium sp. MP_3.2]|uniref:class I SAM-dependent methyltransferase n=1 Tax=Chryseobacterium sp. MP_3.2 TaxID=3071712 RepID=UPI002E035F83|nr:SAM-dependent methyltransferase [Chryseobacterium sp. MP_3.2]